MAGGELREGLLWFDAEPRRSAREKLDQAALRFLERFKRPPTACHVHPSTAPIDHPTIAVVPDPAVLPHHFWVGRPEKEAPGARAAKHAAPH